MHDAAAPLDGVSPPDVSLVGMDSGADLRVFDAASPVDEAPHNDAADAGVPSLLFALIGDYGSDNADEASVSALVHSWNPDFVVTVGDNSYPDGEAKLLDRNIGKYYSDFIGGYHGVYGTGSSTNRFWPAPGNHDWYNPAGNTLAPYLGYFPALPGNGRYYDVAISPLLHLFIVDSGAPGDGPEPDLYDSKGQISANSVEGHWLQSAMAASTSCFKLVLFHHAPYSSGMFSVPAMRWPFAAWGADAVFVGHEHFYERLSIDEGGAGHPIPYVIDGTGGSNLFTPMPPRNPQSQAFDDLDFGALRVTVSSSSLHFEFRTVGGTIVDSYQIDKVCP